MVGFLRRVAPKPEMLKARRVVAKVVIFYDDDAGLLSTSKGFRDMDEEELFPEQRSDMDLFPLSGETDPTKRKLAEFRHRMAFITVSVLADFISETVGDDLFCTLCGFEKLSVPQINMYSLRTGKPLDRVHAHYSKFLVGDDAEYDPSCHEFNIICNRCGYTLKINAGVVMNWYNARKATK